METIYKQEELIFKEYQALLGDNREISPDGLHYLGDFLLYQQLLGTLLW